MADPGGPQRRGLCFLSTLFSQKIPERSDATLRCMIAGQPKPEVTWYKNGQTIDECGSTSSYEFFQNQYIHILHLSCCTSKDTAVYQISAKNCFGMICCSASVDVEVPSETPRPPPSPGDDSHPSCQCESRPEEQDDTNQSGETNWAPNREDSAFLNPHRLAHSPSFPHTGSCPLQFWISSDSNASSSEKPLDSTGTRRAVETRDLENTEEPANGVLVPTLSSHPHEQELQTQGSVTSGLIDGASHQVCFTDNTLKSEHPSPKAEKYISFSLPLPLNSGDRTPGEWSPASSYNSDSDYELCPEITLTCTEEFSEDDLEYLECSDVMTDYSNAAWQGHLQGPKQVFLLESHDEEERDFTEHCLGGGESFLTEMGCGPEVSGDTGVLDATSGSCSLLSQPQEVQPGRGRASTLCPSSLRATGMTLALGSEQDDMSAVTGPGRYKLPMPLPEEAGNESSGISGEAGASHHHYPAGEEFTSDNLLNMATAVPPEGEVKSGDLGTSGRNQGLEVKTTDSLSKRGAEKPPRDRQLGVKGKVRKPRGAPQGSLTLRVPREAAKRPLAPSDKVGCPPAKAETSPEVLSCGYAGDEGASPTPAEREALGSPANLCPLEGTSDCEGPTQALDLQEAIQLPTLSNHPQVQMPDMGKEMPSCYQMPNVSESDGDNSDCIRTSTAFLPSLGGLLEQNPQVGCPELEGCAGDTPHEMNQEWGDSTNEPSGKDSGHGLNVSEVSDASMSPCMLMTGAAMDDSPEAGESEGLFVALLEPPDTTPALEIVCPETVGGEAPPVMWDLEGGDQGTGDTVESLIVDNSLSQEVCSTGLGLEEDQSQGVCCTDFELQEGQNQVFVLCSPVDGTLGPSFQTGSSELPQTMYQSSVHTDLVEPPLSTPTVPWNVSPDNGEGVTGEEGIKVENSTSTLASMVEADLEVLSLSFSGGPEEREPLCSENSPVPFQEGGDGTPSAHEIIDKLISQIPVATCPQAVPMPLTAHFECLQVTEESEDMSVVPMVTKSHLTKYLPISMAANSPFNAPEENSPPAQEENSFQLPSCAQLGLILNSPSADSTKEQFCLTSSRPGVQVQVPLLPEEEGFCNNLPCQIENQPAVADRLLDENVQEKGRETAQRDLQENLPHQDALLENGFQEHLPTTSAVENKTQLTPLDHSSIHLEETGYLDLGTSMTVVTEASLGDDRQTQRSASSSPNSLPEQSKGSGPGHWGVGSKLKIITLEAPVSKFWSSGLTDSKYKEPEAVPTIPGRGWPVSGLLQVGAVCPELSSPDTAAPAYGPQNDSESAPANSRKCPDGKELVGSACWYNLSSQFLSQPRCLESSVDPVEEKENGNDLSHYQEESQLKVALPSSFRQLLSCPTILESSVDPIDKKGVMEWVRAEYLEPPEPTEEVIREESQWQDGSLGQQVEVQSTILPVPCPQRSGETIRRGNSINQNQEDNEGGETESSQCDEAKMELQPVTLRALIDVEGEETTPKESSGSRLQEGREGNFKKATQTKQDRAEVTLPTLPHSGCPAVMSVAPVEADADKVTGQLHDVSEDDSVEFRHCQSLYSDSKGRGTFENEHEKHLSSSGDHPGLPFCPSSEANITEFSTTPRSEESMTEEAQIGTINPPNTSSSPAVALRFISECGSRNDSERAQDPCPRGSILRSRTRTREEGELGHKVSRPVGVTGSETVKKKADTLGSGHVTEGIKKKILSRVAALRLRLEEKENLRKNSTFLKKIPKLEMPASPTDEKKDAKKLSGKREGKAPVLMKKIQAEMFPEHPGNVKLSCQFAEIHEDSTIWWTKDSKSIAQVQRSAGDNSTVSLTISQASQKDQGLYYCCLKNSYGKVSAEFNLTAEVLKQLSSHQDFKENPRCVSGCEEIEFSQLIFREDFLNDSYFGDRLRGQIATEALHFGEGVHRKAFRSKVMRGLTPVFKPGHACVLKVHNAVAYGTKSNDELVQRNYKLAIQECYVQNTARHYAKIYAAEAQPLEGFGEVPEIIPIFLIHRPENNIPYATVEEELIGEFVKYSMRDGKEINFLRRESEAGQKCCTFQHWVYQKTSGCLLVTDMQGVGMKLTDVGIATLAKGYKGFKGNCSMTFIDQFKALHQCNKYCQMLGLKSLQTNSQKQKKPSVAKSKIQPNTAPAKKSMPGMPVEKKA